VELNALFDYNYYLKYVDDVFARLGLVKTRRGRKASKVGSARLAPRTVR
jgi:hypothetical protein